MKKVEREEIIEVFDMYINDNGLFYDFKKYIEDKGYSLEELGFNEDD